MTLTELNFDTDFFEMGLLADANKEKGEGGKMRNIKYNRSFLEMRKVKTYRVRKVDEFWRFGD